MIEWRAINFLLHLKGSRRSKKGKEGEKEEKWSGCENIFLDEKKSWFSVVYIYLIRTSFDNHSWWRSKAMSMEAISWKERKIGTWAWSSCIFFVLHFTESVFLFIIDPWKWCSSKYFYYLLMKCVFQRIFVKARKIFKALKNFGPLWRPKPNDFSPFFVKEFFGDLIWREGKIKKSSFFFFAPIHDSKRKIHL